MEELRTYTLSQRTDALSQRTDALSQRTVLIAVAAACDAC